jgi:TFIIF-interacting CTD phosphatase-like protein
LIDPRRIVSKRFYREHCKIDKEGNIIKDMTIVTEDMGKLVIVDDGDLTYKMYKKNTIKVDEWTKNKKNDDELNDVLDILEQVRYSNDVSKDLKSIMESRKSYI